MNIFSALYLLKSPVNILLNVTGHIKVDDMFDTGYVQTSSSYCCGNQYWSLTTLEAEIDHLHLDLILYYLICYLLRASSLSF